jgi:hypothetical protein
MPGRQQKEKAVVGEPTHALSSPFGNQPGQLFVRFLLQLIPYQFYPIFVTLLKVPQGQSSHDRPVP